MNRMEHEVTVNDNIQYLLLTNVVNVMKFLTYETNDFLASYILQHPYSRGKNVGICFRNGSGRSVNLVCEHVGNTIIGFFGLSHEVNEDAITGEYKELCFGNDYTKAAKAVMDHLVNNSVCSPKEA